MWWVYWRRPLTLYLQSEWRAYTAANVLYTTRYSTAYVLQGWRNPFIFGIKYPKQIIFFDEEFCSHIGENRVIPDCAKRYNWFMLGCRTHCQKIWFDNDLRLWSYNCSFYVCRNSLMSLSNFLLNIDCTHRKTNARSTLKKYSFSR